NKFSAPCLSDKIDALGGSTREDDLVRAHGADVIRNTLPRVFVSFRRARTQCVQSAMNVGVLVLIKIPKRLDHRSRFLRGRSAIEINQRMPVRLFAQNREIFTTSNPINRLGGKLVHTTICSTQRRAPP